MKQVIKQRARDDRRSPHRARRRGSSPSWASHAAAEVLAFEDLLHLEVEELPDAPLLLGRQARHLVAEQVILELETLPAHLGMEVVVGDDVDVVGRVIVEGVFRDKVLDRRYIVIDEQLDAAAVAREAADSVVDDDDIRLEALDQVVEGGQRADHAAGGYVDVDPEGGDAGQLVVLGIGMDRYVALVQVAQDARRGGRVRRILVLVEQGDDAGPARLVVLGRDLHELGVDDARHLLDDGPEPGGIVLLIDVLEVLDLRFGRPGVADVVDVEA